jgi:hypothetical protein
MNNKPTSSLSSARTGGIRKIYSPHYAHFLLHYKNYLARDCGVLQKLNSKEKSKKQSAWVVFFFLYSNKNSFDSFYPN